MTWKKENQKNDTATRAKLPKLFLMAH